MNAKLRKTLNIAAAAIFIIGLAINVQMSLDDPFSNVNNDALAQQTTTGGSCNGTQKVYCYNGGCGATQCSIDAGITIMGSGVSAAGEVTAQEGYFACCSLRCKAYSNSEYSEKSSLL